MNITFGTVAADASAVVFPKVPFTSGPRPVPVKEWIILKGSSVRPGSSVAGTGDSPGK